MGYSPWGHKESYTTKRLNTHCGGGGKSVEYRFTSLVGHMGKKNDCFLFQRQQKA